MPYEILAIYLAAVNLLAAGLTIVDKRRARQGRWRVPEATLLLVAALGGSPAMLLTMKQIRHKTRHRKFMWGLPAMLAVQTAAAVLWLLHRQGWLFV